MKRGWDNWGCSALRKEVSGRPHYGLPVPKRNLQGCWTGTFYGFKLKEGRIRLDRRKKFFITSIVEHWHRLLREAVDDPSLKLFKARGPEQPELVGAVFAHGKGLEMDIFQIPSKPNYPVILWFYSSLFHHGFPSKIGISEISIYLRQSLKHFGLFLFGFGFNSLHPFNITQSQWIIHSHKWNVPPPTMGWLTASALTQSKKTHLTKLTSSSSGTLDSPWQTSTQRVSMPELD